MIGVHFACVCLPSLVLPALFPLMPTFFLAYCCSCPFLPPAYTHTQSFDPWATHICSNVPLPTFICVDEQGRYNQTRGHMWVPVLTPPHSPMPMLTLIHLNLHLHCFSMPAIAPIHLCLYPLAAIVYISHSTQILVFILIILSYNGTASGLKIVKQLVYITKADILNGCVSQKPECKNMVWLIVVSQCNIYTQIVIKQIKCDKNYK